LKSHSAAGHVAHHLGEAGTTHIELNACDSRQVSNSAPTPARAQRIWGGVDAGARSSRCTASPRSECVASWSPLRGKCGSPVRSCGGWPGEGVAEGRIDSAANDLRVRGAPKQPPNAKICGARAEIRSVGHQIWGLQDHLLLDEDGLAMAWRRWQRRACLGRHRGGGRLGAGYGLGWRGTPGPVAGERAATVVVGCGNGVRRYLTVQTSKYTQSSY
jgi:hypothetical protein